MRKWIITDTHFNHENIRNGKLEGTCRPFDYQKQILDNWNQLVAPNDLVYHLGDVIFARKEELADIMNSLNGIKILIRGNHDKADTGNSKRKIEGIPNFYTDSGFVAVTDAVIENYILLSHAPMKLSPDIRMNIHGHFHNSNHRRWEIGYQEMYKNENRYKLLALEIHGYRPFLLEEFAKGK